MTQIICGVQSMIKLGRIARGINTQNVVEHLEITELASFEKNYYSIFDIFRLLLHFQNPCMVNMQEILVVNAIKSHGWISTTIR